MTEIQRYRRPVRQQGLVELLRLLGRLRPLGLPCLVGLVLLGCSSDDSDELDIEKSYPVEFMGAVTPYEEAVESSPADAAAMARGVTRAWEPPSGYSLMNPQEQTIGVFLTEDGEEPLKGFFYKGSGSWHTTLDMDKVRAITYYLYGYVPHSSGVSCTISPNSTYSDGAVLSIKNLPAVTSNDVCVVVGAKNGYESGYSASGNYSITGLRRGDFAYAAASGATSNNYVFLLFDHLYASFNVRMKVAGEYNALRTIKLKELRLQTSSNGTVTKKRHDATVTLRATASAATDPISSIVFTPVGTDAGDGSMFLSPNPLTLTTSYSDYTGYFMPSGVDKLELTSIYDVYDKKGNLTRENCKATNTINISMFNLQEETARGVKYSVSMTIQPTYLYVLSDPDLDNPTVVVSPTPSPSRKGEGSYIP